MAWKLGVGVDLDGLLVSLGLALVAMLVSLVTKSVLGGGGTNKLLA